MSSFNASEQYTAQSVPSTIEIESTMGGTDMCPQSGMEDSRSFAKSKYQTKKKKTEIIRHKKESEKFAPKGKFSADKNPRKVEKMGPQSGPKQGLLMQDTSMMSSFGLANHPDILNKMENALALFTALSDCETTKSACSILFLYVKTHTKSSVSSVVYQYLEKLIHSDLAPQTQEHTQPGWLQVLKNIQLNWSLIVNNKGFKKVSALLSMCVALGLCETIKFPLSMGGFESFSESAKERQIGATDFIDAIMSTMIHFIEGGYMCFKMRSFKPLLYGDIDSQRFRQLYETCMRCNEYYPAGNLRHLENMDDNDYAKLLDDCLDKGRQVIANCTNTFEKNILERYCDNVRKWKAVYAQIRVQGGLRVAPYGIGIFGGTAVGKSSIAQILMITTLKSNGFNADDERLCTFNDDDKYNSNMRTDINGIFLDDMANTKAAFVEKAPSKTVIQVINNSKAYANKADIESKGKVSIQPKVCVITKNVKDGGATVYSNEPASITRRERVTITVTPRPEFTENGMLSERLVALKTVTPTPLIPDLWLCHVQRSYPVINQTTGGTATIGWKDMYLPLEEGNFRILKDVSIYDVIRFITLDSKEYFAHQENLVANSNNLAEKMLMCSKCNMPLAGVCQCKAEDTLDQQVGLRTGISCARTLHRCWSYCDRAHRWMRGPANLERMQDRVDRGATLDAHWLLRWTNWIPTQMLLRRSVLDFVAFMEDERASQLKPWYTILHILLFACIIFVVYVPWQIVLIFLMILLLIYRDTMYFEREMIIESILEDRRHLPYVFTRIRDSQLRYILGLSAMLGTIYAALITSRKLRQMAKGMIFSDKFEQQGRLSPLSDADLANRDAEQNAWSKIPISTLPVAHRVKTTTVNQLETIVFNNLCHLTVALDDNRYFTSDVFFPCSNYAIVPTHLFGKHQSLAGLFKRNEFDGSSFNYIISREHSVDIPNTDFSLIWVPAGGEWKDVRAYIPQTMMKNGPGRLVYKDEHGNPHISRLYHTVGTQHTVKEFYGSKYDLEFNTFEGLCMAVTLAETKAPMISGFHLGGKSGHKRGCCGYLSLIQLENAMEALSRIPGVLLANSAGTLPEEILGVQYFQGRRIHPKSPLNFLTEEAQVTAYGEVTGRAKYYSEVVTSAISDSVTRHTGVEQQWGKPQFGKNYPWQASLDVATHPALGVEGAHLRWAVRDYQNQFCTVLDDFSSLKTDIVPLTNEEVVNGKIGIRFVDKMSSTTSVGYPLGGPKNQYQYDVTIPEDARRTDCVDFTPEIWSEVARMETCYLKHERCYPIFKACLKDEPTPLDKEKVRVFQGAPIAMQILVRRYFLPIVRCMSMLPIAAECAVGVNAHSQEWDELAKHMRKYGSDRILAGDYSKYDLRMPAQMVLAAFSVLISIADRYGYTTRDLIVMRGLATDVAYPTIAYNGDLIGLFGSNPSGHNLTVYINCIVNSLLMRCAYYHIEGPLVPFRHSVALMTYGDDCKGSVHERCRNFNHLSVAEYLANRGMVFTMPDKTATPTPFMLDGEADFLKRNSVYHPKLQCELGALQEDSIFKSLHAHLRSAFLSEKEICMAAIESALVEWFVHGEDVYERRRKQLYEIAQECDIIHGCPTIGYSYGTRADIWLEKYGSGTTENSSPCAM